MPLIGRSFRQRNQWLKRLLSTQHALEYGRIESSAFLRRSRQSGLLHRRQRWEDLS